MPSNDIRSTENVKKGFIHGVFRHPALITTHMKRLFGNAEMKIQNETPASFEVNVVSPEWVKEPYNRTFRYTYIAREDGTKKITNVEEL